MKYALRRLLYTPRDLESELLKHFPGSEWVTTHSDAMGLASSPEISQGAEIGSGHSAGAWQGRSLRGLENRPNQPASPPMFAVIGGTKFDATALENWCKGLSHDAVVVTGDGRGSEKALRELLSASGHRVDVPGTLDIPKALEGQTELILSMTQDSRAPVVLIGEGGRVAAAKKWLKRGRWGREVIEIG